MTSPDDGRSEAATGLHWASRITTVSIEMVLPGLIGLWVDRKAGTLILFTVLGFVFGITIGIWQLTRMTHFSEDDTPSGKGNSDK